MTSNSVRKSIIVFDVNETLLDINILEPLFRRMFNAEHAMREWFAQLILYSEALTLAEAYTPFGELGGGVLRMLGRAKRVNVTDADLDELRSLLQAMPAHPDVPDALRRLKEAGFRLVTLTNSAPQSGLGPLERAGIASFFERQLSIDAVRRYKPAPETYRMVAGELGVETRALRLVAAHTWDTLGAQQAGCLAALVARSGNAPLLLPTVPVPDVIGPDMTMVAEQIIRLRAG